MNAKTLRPAIGGNWASLLLPIAADDSIEFDKLAEEIDILIDAGVDGIYSNGTAGEFHNQTEAEFDSIQAMLAERCKASSTPFVIGACQPDPLIMLNRVRRAGVLDPGAIQVILPDWWPLNDAEAVDFLKRAAEAADGIPLILYNPPHAKRVLAPRELGMVCAAVPEVAGIKLADGDGSWYVEARRHLSGLSLFVPGHHLATGTREGVAAGSLSNVACLSPRGAQTWTVSMRNDIDAALDLERRICAFMDAHIVPFRQEFGYSNAALDKLLSAIGNWGPVGTRLRFPYRSIDMAEAVRLRPIARAELPDLFL
ncbi:dihydrodipicolinate synthase family protein [Rhizobium leguminosarum]|uniref:dihydrodipicolinate synthase family protein n=1 Tax=Rhizobium leguminosarum TaxID=384 RepID=UPI0013B86398|nr:dihydrodipicolinate synthase family protein [Rhizobium leguminosarum]NEI56788.1 dihydrodipicolinate synthase family protein [Rhizobium leguminosarum]NEI85636.1 dihydrodipicolinate synthase family protein [Rhizobium leguminosarum]UIK21646.1 dihydrodipicolinate synthase family protein [Rhizobium leguminosarum]